MTAVAHAGGGQAPTSTGDDGKTSSAATGADGSWQIEGLPAGIPLDIDAANRELSRRQGGYGRGGRQKIEKDAANPEILVTEAGGYKLVP